ncbi:hypothetical protein B0A50_04530 [Salinomyces thailandicus]|uniref:Uncharacterized protein n=1 Tax=Salinomyces thailandicus TaxID=706561 RepID=A0A4U0TXK3_9PEZI|nr:hypothetical protein B0A50_04530 [Salinomyces thailandica]
MLLRPAVLFALSSLATRIAVAAPPACLIAAVNTQPDPSDLNAVCSGGNATEVKRHLCKQCGSNFDIAMSGFSGVCSQAGVTIKDSSACEESASSSSSSFSSTRSAISTESASITSIGSMSVVTGTGASGATHPVSTTYYDSACSCTKTSAIAASPVAGSSGTSTATGTGADRETNTVAVTGGVTSSARSGASTSAGSNADSDSGSSSSLLLARATMLRAVVLRS